MEATQLWIWMQVFVLSHRGAYCFVYQQPLQENPKLTYFLDTNRIVSSYDEASRACMNEKGVLASLHSPARMNDATQLIKTLIIRNNRKLLTSDFIYFNLQHSNYILSVAS